jgi:bifunctional DNase/RNase
MRVEKNISRINNYLKKRKETKVLELKIKDYNNSNFYLALVFNKKIEKFKVLYIPLDVVESSDISEYCCYQFMEVKSVLYLIDTIKKNLPKYEELKKRDLRRKKIENFQIEIDVYLDNKQYDFYMTRYLPKEWEFFFETIVMLFEHAPNIMSELATEILSVAMNTNEEVKYQRSLKCNVLEEEMDPYFSSLKGKKEKIDYLERINGKYYAIVKNHLFIIEYLYGSKILNIYCDNEELTYNYMTYQIINEIKKHNEKRFYKITIEDAQERKNYLCLGTTKTGIKVIKENKLTTLPFQELKKYKIKIIEDKNNELKNKLEQVIQS